MSKAGGIAYLIKHGRAPMPSVTRTRMSGKGYAAGGTPINKSLGYGPEYDYVFVPGGMTLDASGQPQYQSGRFELRAPPPPPTAAQDPYARTEDPGGRGDRYEGGNKVDPNSTSMASLAGILGRAGYTGISDAMAAANNGYGPFSDPTGYADARDAAAKGLGVGNTAPVGGDESAAETNRLAAQEAAAFTSQPGYSAPTGYGPGDTGPPSSAMGFGRESRDSDMGGWGGEGRDSAGRGGDGGGGAATGGSGGDASGGGDRGTRGGFADGGPIGMAAGGIGSLPNHGGFVGSYAKGGRMLRGPGDGLSDGIPATIGNKQPARLADGEFVVSADVVSALGGGSTEAGSKKLYAMMDRIRKAAHGTKKQVKPVKERKVLPA